MFVDEILKKNPNVKIKNPKIVQSKIEKIVADGYDKLLVIADFDYTLSKYHDDNGEKCLITHAIFVECTQEIAPNLSIKLQNLTDKYLDIELNPNVSFEEKSPHMEKWWRKSQNFIVDEKFTIQDVEYFLGKAKILLREFAVEFLNFVEERNVPLIVFSAGIGNIIEIILKKSLGHIPENLHIVANVMEFDQNEICVAFSEPIIHSFCKNSFQINDHNSFCHQIENRKNVLLIGDSLGDVDMDKGIGESLALKIGYLNRDFDVLLEKYLNVFDIVLIDCQSMEVPLEIVKLCQNKN